jgi:hypothetical protein
MFYDYCMYDTPPRSNYGPISTLRVWVRDTTNKYSSKQMYGDWCHYKEEDLVLSNGE